MEPKSIFSPFIFPSLNTYCPPFPTSESDVEPTWTVDDIDAVYKKVSTAVNELINTCKFEPETEHQTTRLYGYVKIEREKSTNEETLPFFLVPPNVENIDSTHIADLVILQPKPSFIGGSKYAFRMLDAYRCVKKNNTLELLIIDKKNKAFVQATNIFLLHKSAFDSNITYIPDRFKNEHKKFKHMTPRYTVKSWGTLNDPTARANILIQENGGLDLRTYLERNTFDQITGLKLCRKIVKILLANSSFCWGFLDVKPHNLTIDPHTRKIKIIDAGAWIKREDHSLILNDGFTPIYADPSIVCAKFLFQRNFVGETPETKKALQILHYNQNDSRLEGSEEEKKTTENYLKQKFQIKHLSIKSLNAYAAAVLILPILAKTSTLSFHFTSKMFEYPWSKALSDFNIRLNPGIYSNTKRYQSLKNTPVQDLFMEMEKMLFLKEYCFLPENSSFQPLMKLIERCISLDLNTRPHLEELDQEINKLLGINKPSLAQALFKDDLEFETEYQLESTVPLETPSTEKPSQRIERTGSTVPLETPSTEKPSQRIERTGSTDLLETPSTEKYSASNEKTPTQIIPTNGAKHSKKLKAENQESLSTSSQ